MRRSLFQLAACSRTGLSVSGRQFRSYLYHQALRHISDQKKDHGDPLRILFCGSDWFSAASLRALYKFSQCPDSNILSIDVVTRNDKRVGRGFKIIKAPPIKGVALDLGLPIHQIDTFTGWDPPQYAEQTSPNINLIVAVSFGLFIPPRILTQSKYSGLNVHPSMLPDLRGAGPIQWTILQGRTTTGVTLQTLHHRRFDEGTILDQTPAPGLAIPNPDEITGSQLTALLAPIGAKMLVDGIRNRVYIPPHVPILAPGTESTTPLAHAPKIPAALHAIDFETLPGIDILRRSRTISPLRTWAKRILGDNIQIKLDGDMRASTTEDIPGSVTAKASLIPPGIPYAIVPANKKIYHSDKPLIVNTVPGPMGEIRRIVIPSITVASMKPGPGAAAAARAGLFLPDPLCVEYYKLYYFRSALSVPGMATSPGAAERQPDSTLAPLSSG
ncbi:uncharacterized protein Z518_05930 [Rhinocladiella mackenziei CBS 650.93]|uniref:methionyl-tRNA formyltransferase n=1 Tax=Rhinocladiella mackenziei CBS 650.93 TaxID=1442369 RepID=A0A0D2H3U5_9EURO|nr:uncharacterized protein Z518_05930 [Rhinocladiella mackenziei CBS 650.93]KIX05058.1 hypothetical protein Z518_05930 [Rhinocladiella mackenziei CBS 650.93]